MTETRTITIQTDHAALVLGVTEDRRLTQHHFGAVGTTSDKTTLAYPTAGDGWVFEPALAMTHADGNTSTDLRVVDITSEGCLTKIELQDPTYPLAVQIFFRTYAAEDVFESWVEISHQEEAPVTISRFASSAIDFGSATHWLTQFHGQFANEANMAEERLTFGIKTLDSKLGVRAQEFRNPWFLLSRGGPAQEDEGEVFGGSLAWSGSFAFQFEVTPDGNLRALCGMNPFASAYHLQPSELFTSPKMVWGWSGTGTGTLSRNLHSWSRTNVIRDGFRERAVLLNNWEATYFDFDEKKIISLIGGAKSVGMDLFLLDDGWFGVKYPRDGDFQGLGDWTPDPKKLPNGLGALCRAAEALGLRFGIWLEPEMVNPKSDLFEAHPDWAIQQPKRPLELQRNQLVLDLTNPEVQEFVFQVANRTLLENPGISYVKWDCNRYLTQPGSPYLSSTTQSHLWIDYVRALYAIFDRLASAHPNVEIMMCAGGGGRVDYGAMRFAQEFWPSDRTDPARRVFIQWGYSLFFPSISVSGHVTAEGERPLKFAFDVAMSARLGMDMDLDRLSPSDLEFTKHAVTTYKSIRSVVQMGTQYRLESPYAGSRSALMYIESGRAVVFVYSLGDSPAANLVLSGLEAKKRYRIQELNLPANSAGFSGEFSGAELLSSGIPVAALGPYSSSVLELTLIRN